MCVNPFTNNTKMKTAAVLAAVMLASVSALTNPDLLSTMLDGKLSNKPRGYARRKTIMFNQHMHDQPMDNEDVPVLTKFENELAEDTDTSAARRLTDVFPGPGAMQKLFNRTQARMDRWGISTDYPDYTAEHACLKGFASATSSEGRCGGFKRVCAGVFARV